MSSQSRRAVVTSILAAVPGLALAAGQWMEARAARERAEAEAKRAETKARELEVAQRKAAAEKADAEDAWNRFGAYIVDTLKAGCNP